jgi:DNA polymerase III alpha subunit
MDIDIDFFNREAALALFKTIPASRVDQNQLIKHATGVYLHEVPVDAVTGLCQIPYDQAEKEGYFKIDFLNVGIYKGVRDEEHLVKLMETEPIWDLLQQEDFCNLLFHVNGHWDILKKMNPQSIPQLAAVLAMIRPAKRYLIGKTWNEVGTEVWTKPTNNEYYWKKSHAVAYATAVVVQMNLICEQLAVNDV